MRVLMVTTSFPRHARDSAGAFLVPLAKMLNAEVLAPMPGDDGVEGIRVHRFAYSPTGEQLFHGEGAPRNLRTSWRMKALGLNAMLSMVREIRRRQPDVVFAHWLPTALASVLSGAPTLAYAHGSDVRFMARFPSLTRMIARRAEILVPSESLQRALPVPSRIVPLPVENMRIDGAKKEFDVGFLGRLIPEKGVKHLANAAKKIGRSVVVAGPGPERVEGVTHLGPVAPDERARFFASIRLLVVPSVEAEGSPMVIWEAFAAGVPVVGFDVPGVSEALGTDAVTTVGDDDALAALIERALTDDAWRSSALARGRAAVASRSPRALAPIYEQLLGDAARRARHG